MNANKNLNQLRYYKHINKLYYNLKRYKHQFFYDETGLDTMDRLF